MMPLAWTLVDSKNSLFIGADPANFLQVLAFFFLFSQLFSNMFFSKFIIVSSTLFDYGSEGAVQCSRGLCIGDK